MDEWHEFFLFAPFTIFFIRAIRKFEPFAILFIRAIRKFEPFAIYSRTGSSKVP
jgi:hypothetical protein